MLPLDELEKNVNAARAVENRDVSTHLSQASLNTNTSVIGTNVNSQSSSQVARATTAGDNISFGLTSEDEARTFEAARNACEAEKLSRSETVDETGAADGEGTRSSYTPTLPSFVGSYICLILSFSRFGYHLRYSPSYPLTRLSTLPLYAKLAKASIHIYIHTSPLFNGNTGLAIGRKRLRSSVRLLVAKGTK